MKTSHIMSGSCWLPLMNPITRPSRRGFDHGFEPPAHDLLELHPLVDDRRAPAAVQQCLFHTREAAPEHADDEIVLEIGLGSGWAATVVLLEQRDEPVGDRGEDLSVLQGPCSGVRRDHREQKV